MTTTINNSALTEYSRSGWGWFVQAGGYLTLTVFWLDDGAGRNGRVQLRMQVQVYF